MENHILESSNSHTIRIKCKYCGSEFMREKDKTKKKDKTKPTCPHCKAWTGLD